MLNDNQSRLDRGPGESDLDEYDDCGNRQNRHHAGMHGEAQRAVIGDPGIGVKVRDLDDSKERKENQAEDGNRRQSTQLRMAVDADSGPGCYQPASWRSEGTLYKGTHKYLDAQIIQIVAAYPRGLSVGLTTSQRPIRLNCVR